MNTFIKVVSASLLFAGVSMISSTSYASGDDIRNVGAFTKIKVEGSTDVVITQDTKSEVKVEGDAESIKYIITEVKNGTLYIRQEPDINNIKATVYVRIPELEGVSVSGSSEVEATNKITTKNLDLAIKGSGDIKMDIETSNLNAAIHGSGDIMLRGSADVSNVAINGSGDFEAKSLSVKKMSIASSGSADCKVNVSDALNVTLAGSGDVRYTGPVTNVVSQVAGSGSVARFK